MKTQKIIFLSLIILSSQFLANCYVPPAPIFKLKPQTNNLEWYKGKEIATLTNDSVSVVISFDRSLNDDYLFDVDITNYSEKTLLVDPEKFNYKTISGIKKQNELFTATAAKDPEKIILNLQKSYSQHKSKMETQAMMYSLGYFLQFAGQTKALVTNDVELSKHIDHQSHKMKEDELVDDIQNQKISESLNNSSYIWEILALRKTSLYPNESISGKVFFPVNESAQTLEFSFPIGEQELKILFKQEVIQLFQKYVNPNL